MEGSRLHAFSQHPDFARQHSVEHRRHTYMLGTCAQTQTWEGRTCSANCLRRSRRSFSSCSLSRCSCSTLRRSMRYKLAPASVSL